MYKRQVCCTPPHLSAGKEDEVPALEAVRIDTGLSPDAANARIAPGDRVILSADCHRLLGTRATGPALDNRAGCAALLRCLHLLSGEKLALRLTVLLSSREETGRQGASTAAYAAAPDACVVVDVSFAVQPGVPASCTAVLGGGPMVGLSAALDKTMGRELMALAESQGIPYQLEAMGDATGTNADRIGITGGGVRCALLSIPQRNMHTPAEMIDLADVEHTARLLAAYVRKKNEEVQ